MSSLPEPPPEFLCPITLDLVRDPVTAPTGITYDRAAITSWLVACGQRTCPMTLAELRPEDLVPNHTLRRLIHNWRAAHRSSGGVATTPEEEAAVAELEAAARAGDADQCAAAARWLRRMVSLAEPNRSRLASAGAARALAAAFTSFADAADAEVLDFVVEALALFIPTIDDEEAVVAIGSSSASVARLVAIAANGNEHRRLQAVVVIREIVSLSFHRYGAGAIDLSADQINAIIQVLVKTIRDNVSTQATRACLVAAYQLAHAAAATLAAAGLVPLAVELLVDADRSMAEKALAALDATLASGEGRASARAHALAVPVLVDIFFWVSDEVTELVLSALLQICKKGPDEDDEVGSTTATARRAAIIEALARGALQKVIMLLQAVYKRETKDKAKQLLRLLVRYKDGAVVCADPRDLRGIRRGTRVLTT